MYSPSYNRLEDRAEVLGFMRAHGFVLLVTGTGGTLHASHLPATVHDDAGRIRIDMHMARNNPQWQEFFDDEVLVVFSGPHAYISPTWYASADAVPTWNYAVVHVYGRARAIDDAALTGQHVERLAARYEHGSAAPWIPRYDRRRLAGIVGVEIESFHDRGLIAFPLRSRGECFGSLIVDCSGRQPLSDQEKWICQIVAHTAAAARFRVELNAPDHR